MLNFSQVCTAGAIFFLRSARCKQHLSRKAYHVVREGGRRESEQAGGKSLQGETESAGGARFSFSSRSLFGTIRQEMKSTEIWGRYQVGNCPNIFYHSVQGRGLVSQAGTMERLTMHEELYLSWRMRSFEILHTPEMMTSPGSKKSRI